MIGVEKVKSKPTDFVRYKDLNPQIFEQSLQRAKELSGLKIIHINSTQLGGGVSELLHSQVPLEQSLGLDSSWYIIKAPKQFFKVTKKIHNLLQGEEGDINLMEKFFFMNWLRTAIAPFFKSLIKKEKPDIVLIHDPQPMPLIDYILNNKHKNDITALLRMHIDLSEPNKNILDFLKPFIEKYDLTIYSHQSYRPQWQDEQETAIIMPAINPFTEKNKPMDKEEAQRILRIFNINTNKPIAAQVSRFDPWKDPLGTLEAYQLAKKKHPDLQLILAGIFQAYDDPQALEIFAQVEKEVQNDKDVFLFSDPKALKEVTNDQLINAIYTASDIVIQKSIKEGFGLVVTEAMWKNNPVIGGNTKGIALQIKHGQNGFLVNSPQEAGQYLVQLLENKEERIRLGEAAHNSVKDNFLMSRLVLDHLKTYSQYK